MNIDEILKKYNISGDEAIFRIYFKRTSMSATKDVTLGVCLDFFSNYRTTEMFEFDILSNKFSNEECSVIKKELSDLLEERYLFKKLQKKVP